MKRKAYPTDVTNEQWAILKPHLTQPRGRGSPRRVNLRKVVNALLYLSRTGCEWRLLPHDLTIPSTLPVVMCVPSGL